MADQNLLSISDLEAWYGKQKVLRGINLEVAEGEIVGIFGHNGAGKTTILNSILGYGVATAGSILFAGEEIRSLSAHEVAQLGIGIAPQGLGIFGSLRVRENMEFGSPLRRVERQARAKEVRENLAVIREKWDHFGSELSGGQRQLVSIGRELAKQPRLLLLDEPSVGLAPKMVSETLNLLKDLQRRGGVAALLVEQNIPSASKVIDRGYVIRQGEVVFAGDAAAFADPHSLLQYF